MQIIKKQDQLGTILFNIGILIHLLIMVVGYSEWDVPMQGRLMQLAFGLFCVKILMTFYTKIEWIVLLLLGVLGTVSYFSTHDEYVLSVIVMIFAAKNVDMKQVCKWIFVTALVFTIGIALLSLIGIGGITVDIRDYGRGGVEARWCLGFGHANNFHGTVWYIISLAMYLFCDKMNWKHYCFLSIVNVGVFGLTASRGGVIAAQVVIILIWLIQRFPKIAEQKWGYVLGVVEILGVAIISIMSAMISFEKHPILAIPDRLSTGRLRMAYWYADISKWRLFSPEGEIKVLDNGWIRMFYCYGYVFGIIFIIFHLYLIYKTWKDKNALALVLIVASVFYIFMEATYTVNSAYLLSGLSYIVAMLFMADKRS